MVQTRTKAPVGRAKITNDQERSFRNQAIKESTSPSRIPPNMVWVETGIGSENLATNNRSKRIEMPKPRMPWIDFGKNFKWSSFGFRLTLYCSYC